MYVRDLSTEEQAVTTRTVMLEGVRHVGGRCCQHIKCAICGAPRHEQCLRGLPEASSIETACERCDADLFL